MYYEFNIESQTVWFNFCNPWTKSEIALGTAVLNPSSNNSIRLLLTWQTLISHEQSLILSNWVQLLRTRIQVYVPFRAFPSLLHWVYSSRSCPRFTIGKIAMTTSAGIVKYEFSFAVPESTRLSDQREIRRTMPSHYRQSIDP